LIPEAWFIGAHWSVLLVVGAVAMFTLMHGADWLVKGASGLAYELGVPKIIVGATVVSLGTTAPECAVSVMAAWGGKSGLALGNAVGSIIADTGLIFGLGCLLVALPADRFLLSRQGWVQVGAATLLAALCYGVYAVDGQDATLDRWVGVLFLAMLVAYMAISIRWSKQMAGSATPTHGQGEPSAASSSEGVDGARTASRAKQTFLLLGLIVVGLAVVVLSSDVLIKSVSELARQMGIPDVVIASTIVALGTSLPELVVGLTSLRRGHPELLVGNVIGADILNVLFVIGAAAIAMPLPIIDPLATPPEIFLWLHLPMMMLVLLTFRVFIHAAVKKGRFSKWMGWPLVGMYLAFVIVQFVLSLAK